MNQAALRLRAPVTVGRHVDAAHRIGLVTLAGSVDTNRDVTQDRMLLVIHVHRFLSKEARRARTRLCDVGISRRVKTVGSRTTRPRAAAAGRTGARVSTAVYRVGPRSTRGYPAADRPA